VGLEWLLLAWHWPVVFAVARLQLRLSSIMQLHWQPDWKLHHRIVAHHAPVNGSDFEFNSVLQFISTHAIRRINASIKLSQTGTSIAM
jgi:hypothetical protein